MDWLAFCQRKIKSGFIAKRIKNRCKIRSKSSGCKNKVSSDDEPTVFKKVVSEKDLTKEEETKEDQIVDANESSEVWVNDKGVALLQARSQVKRS